MHRDLSPSLLECLRNTTPGTDEVIHLNNAGASLMPRVVLDTVLDHLRLEARIGAYEAAEAEHARIEKVYASVARLLNAHPDEIAVVENATRAWDMAFYALPLERGDIVLTSTTEYAGNYISYLQLQQTRGIEIRILPNDERGQVSVSAARDILKDPRVRLISLPLIASNGGPVQPVGAIGPMARAAGVWFLLDACQGVGHLPVDVKKIGCHMLSATSRKYLRGPRGMGFLYIEQELCRQLEPPFLDLHAARLEAPDRFRVRPDARRFENWECNVAAKLGMGSAIDHALDIGIDVIWRRILALSDSLREGLAAIAGVRVHDAGLVKSGIVSFAVEGLSAAEVQRALAAQEKRINVSTTTFRSTMLDMQQRGLTELVRASVHAYNAEHEIDTLVTSIDLLAKGKAHA